MGDNTKKNKASKIISCCRDGAYLIHGYEDALSGVSDSFLPIYDYGMLVQITQERMNMEEDPAIRYVDNIIIRRLPSDKANGPIISYAPAQDGKGRDDPDGKMAMPENGSVRQKEGGVAFLRHADGAEALAAYG